MRKSKQDHVVDVSRVALVGLMFVSLSLTRCGTPTAGTGGIGPRVTFSEPQDGQTVTTPVKVKMSAENFTVEPVGLVKEGHGHLHIMVDIDCVPTGQTIPKDDTHLHYGQGQTEAELKLNPGQHRLCLQAADSAHVALAGDGMKQTISITVK